MDVEKASLIHLGKLAAMFGGFFLLLCEIRFEHRAAVIGDWRPWIPIVFCGCMIVLIPLAGLFWDRGARKLLVIAYCLTVCLGMLGIFFHSEGHLLPRLAEVFSVWTNNLQDGASIKAAHPPLLAPCAFLGLGLIGVIFSLDTEKVFPKKLSANKPVKSVGEN